ncbi:MAG: hypothetical protein U0132_01010 [Gemmatimonadaceae bacterium]
MNDFLSLVLWATSPLMQVPTPGATLVPPTDSVVQVTTAAEVSAGARQLTPAFSRVSAGSSRADSTSNDQQKRPKAIEYSEWYGRRLTIHRIASYTALPLFATEYWLGNKLMNDLVVKSWVRPMHGTVASAIGVVFGVNTLTGLWNLYDSRNDPNDRTRKIVHTVGMLAADAGFLVTASLAGDDGGEGGSYNGNNAQNHKNAALVSIGLASASTVMMWIWKH